MFEIFPEPLELLEERIESYAAEMSQIWPKAKEAEIMDLKKKPFVQLSSEDLAAEDVEQILGYAGIPKSNGPIGLPIDIEPKQLGADILIFPVKGLEAYLREKEPDIIQSLEAAGSMDAFAEKLGDKMTARQYLVGGVIECIRFCNKYGEALVIHW